MVATSFNSKLLSLDNSFTNLSEIRINQVSQATTLRTKVKKLESAVESLLEGKLTPKTSKIIQKTLLYAVKYFTLLF